MKKILLLILLFQSFNQAYAQYIPTRSERSGNGVTPDGQGYVYNFGSDLEDNCYDGGGNNVNYNQFSNPNYSCSLNTSLGYFNLSFNGSQTATDVLVNHFTSGNCILVENGSTGPLDMREPTYQFIEARVRSNVALDKFGMYIGIKDENGFFQTGDGPGNTTVALAVNTWTTVQAPAIFAKYDGSPYNPSQTIGLAFYALNTAGPQPAGTIEIDYVRIGSAAQTSIASGFVSPSGNGYTFGFEGDVFHTCLDQMNVSANANFDFQMELSNNQLLITQADANVSNDIFSIEFTDQDCFLNTVDLSDEENRIIEINITSDQDMPSVGLALMSRSSDNIRMYSEVLSTFSLTAGVEKTISVPVSLATSLGDPIDGAHVNGIAFIVDPTFSVLVRKENKEQVAPVHYTIDYIKIGDIAGPATPILGSSKKFTQAFSVYPNPSSGQLTVNVFKPSAQGFTLSLIDYTGQHIYSSEASSSLVNLDLSTYRQGMYLLQLVSAGEVYTEKIILK